MPVIAEIQSQELMTVELLTSKVLTASGAFAAVVKLTLFEIADIFPASSCARIAK